MLRTSAVDGNRVFLYTQETGTPVSVPVPEILTNLLRAIKPVGGYFSSVVSPLGWTPAPTSGDDSSRTCS
jgi:hypothetical protein